MTEDPSRPESLTADRRGTHPDRRRRDIPVAVDRRQGERRGGERRRQVDPTTCERDYTDEEIAFMKAMDQYKRDHRRPFPAWGEVLAVVQELGYVKVAERTALPGLQPRRERPRGAPRRTQSIPVVKDYRQGDRRGAGPRGVADEEDTFTQAMDQYKRDNRRPFPTWSEVLEVLRALGYRATNGAAHEAAVPPKG